MPMMELEICELPTSAVLNRKETFLGVMMVNEKFKVTKGIWEKIREKIRIVHDYIAIITPTFFFILT